MIKIKLKLKYIKCIKIKKENLFIINNIKY